MVEGQDSDGERGDDLVLKVVMRKVTSRLNCGMKYMFLCLWRVVMKERRSDDTR